MYFGATLNAGPRGVAIRIYSLSLCTLYSQVEFQHPLMADFILIT